MPLFSISRDIIELLKPIVRLNGARFDAIKCMSISCNAGAGGLKAEFTIPQYLFDTSRKRLSDSLISVKMKNTYDGSDDGHPDFVGYVDVDNATISEGEDGVTMSASSITAFFNKVGIGDSDDQPVLKYPLSDPITGEPTTWTPKRVLEDLFDRLPVKYKSRVQLGNTTVLDRSQLVELPELTFRFENYATAIDKVLALYGDVTFTERFVGNVCYLDFYRIQAPGAPTVRVKVADWRDIVDVSADVQALSHNQTINDAITRVKAYGTKKRYIISVVSNSGVPEADLVKGWDESLEAFVLADPKRAKPGAPGYVPGMEKVFCRWYFPAILRPYLKMKDLGVKMLPVGGQEGPEYKAKVWKIPTILSTDAAGATTGVESADGQIIKSCKMELDKGYFELSNVEDGMNITAIGTSSSGNFPATTWAAAKIGITFCLEGNKWLVADTGADQSSGIEIDLIDDGLYERITRDDLTFIQYTTFGTPITAPSGAEVEFGCYFFNEDTSTWVNITEPLIGKDDTAKLLNAAHEHLRARNRRHHAYDVTIPYFSKAFVPGYRLIVEGQDNWPGERMTITGVEWDLANNETKVTVDNVKPPNRRKGRMRAA